MPADTKTQIPSMNGFGAPTPFSFAPRYRWVPCEIPHLKGEDGSCFAAEVRTNPNGDEEREYARRFREWLAAKGDDANEAAERAVLEAAAPRVRGWNAMGADADGNAVPIPPPAEAGWEAFFAIESPYRIWLLALIQTIHLPKRDDPKGGSGSEQPPPSPEPSTATPSESGGTDRG